MQEIGVRSLGQEDAPEKGMAADSSILPGEFHGQSSLVGYSPWGCKGVGHNLATNTFSLSLTFKRLNVLKHFSLFICVGF